jgi:hypothetical protein
MSEGKFVPPVFGKFGKKLKDLLKKKFDFENKIVTKHKTKTAGLTVEAGGVLGCQNIDGFFKGKYKDKKYGEVEAELSTKGKVALTSKLDQLAKGLEVNYNGGSDPASKKKGLNNKIGLEYAQEFFAVSGSVDVNQADIATNAVVDVAGVVGMEGFSVGLQAAVDANAPQKLSDYNMGVEYTRDNLTATVITEESGKLIHGYGWLQVYPAYQVGVGVDLNPNVNEPSKRWALSLGTEYQLDVDTTVKASAKTDGVIKTAIQHNLQNPSLQLGLAAQFTRKSSDCLTADKFGLTLTFGDY